MREDLERKLERIMETIIGSTYCGYRIEKVRIQLNGAVAFGYSANERRYGVLRLDLSLDGFVVDASVIYKSDSETWVRDYYQAEVYY